LSPTFAVSSCFLGALIIHLLASLACLTMTAYVFLSFFLSSHRPQLTLVTICHRKQWRWWQRRLLGKVWQSFLPGWTAFIANQPPAPALGEPSMLCRLSPVPAMYAKLAMNNNAIERSKFAIPALF
jgi:hypothetical protein